MHYRVLRISECEHPERWLKDCSAERRERIERVRFGEARLQLICADHLAREMLAEALDCAPETLHFDREPGGKPFLVGGGMHFNLSHSGDFVACAVDVRPVGIDIEVPRKISEALMRRVCHPEELPADARDFLRIWTAKEAYLKYTGLGIRMELRELNTVQGFAPHRLLQEQSEQYALSVVYDE